MERVKSALTKWVFLEGSNNAIKFRCCVVECTFTSGCRHRLHEHLMKHRSLDSDGQCQCPVSYCGLLFAGDVAYQNHLSFHSYNAFLQQRGLLVIVKHAVASTPLPICSCVPRPTNMLFYDGSDMICLWSSCKAVFHNIEEFFSHVDGHVDSKRYRGSGSWLCYWKDCMEVPKTAFFLRRHLKTHTGERLCACPYCGIQFSNNTKLRDHLQRYQIGNFEFQCKFCQKYFPNERLLHEHGRTHISRFKCPICSVPVSSPSILRNHFLLRHQDRKLFQCTKCSKRFKTRPTLLQHQNVHAPKNIRYVCTYCWKRFTTKFYVETHIRVVHLKSLLYQCHLCPEQFRRGAMLSRHLRKAHDLLDPNGIKFRYKLCTDGLYRKWDKSCQSDHVFTPSVEYIAQDIARNIVTNEEKATSL